MDQLFTLRTFVAVARQGSFTGASRHLRISPSVATRAVAQLEERLGLALLTRTTRSVRLTERGQIYLESCQRLLEDLDEADRRVRGENAEPRGELHLSAPIVFGRLHVLPVVQKLLAAHPALSIRMHLSDRNQHLVDEGIDAAVRLGELKDSSLIALKVGTVRRVLVASPHYVKQRGTPRSPAELSRHELIAFESLDATNEWRFGEKEKPVRIQPRLILNSADTAIAAAEQGVGIARTLSYQVADAVLAGRLVLLLGAFAPPLVPVSVIYPGRRSTSANVGAFVRTARSHFEEHPLLPVEAWRPPRPAGGKARR
ncbi:LysR family transcriptional regulator [Corallococcus exiguus]|uniref:LysR family transcriptional regulator n=1 Tax=Corallococcus TaxID=83461 RepID=UPI000EA042D3|nr:MULTISPECIES: LysR family transcriptional regulator [Corallococcus]NNC21983.1 LysR family transcriptional regulator [Corallococcus exiguus]NRD67325.1 LysR family transcriptional regulator [Corallococcus exiguus]RKH14452.1 LysR family transcriptional regulator [Corallococcus sp. CA041A]RUO87285.1 LysR family transcriptional regulator [Corallococcus sp. AB018]